jgi:hypothetical protein
MKEVLTKGFWKEVKKTFQDALQGATPEGNAEPASTADDPKPPSTSEAPPSSATSEEK